MPKRRTLAYNSTVYTSPVLHRTQLATNVRWNPPSGGLVAPAVTPLARRLLVCRWRAHRGTVTVLTNIHEGGKD